MATALYTHLSWRWYRRSAIPHKLSSPLIVTLTSYPARYPTLALTLASLLAQSMLPDHIYLWIAEEDLPSLPENVRRLQGNGVEVRRCHNLRSYKKIIPAIEHAPGAFLVTADDDVYYPRHWLRELVNAYRPGQKEVLCARGHRIRLDDRGLPLPYHQWQLDVDSTGSERLLFPTTGGGALYEPGIFHQDVHRADIFLTLCPTADDVWLYWMAALNGARFRKVGRRRRLIHWLNSQRLTLYSVNRVENDRQIANMILQYGFPMHPTPSSGRRSMLELTGTATCAKDDPAGPVVNVNELNSDLSL